jgi:hypothetical protein
MLKAKHHPIFDKFDIFQNGYLNGKAWTVSPESNDQVFLCIDGQVRKDCNTGELTHGWYASEEEANEAIAKFKGEN